MQKTSRAIVLIALIISLAACSPAAKATPTAAVLNLPAVGSGQNSAAAQPAGQGQNQPAQPNATAYAAPAQENQPADAAAQTDAKKSYPAPADQAAPQGVPARENRSKVTAQLLDPLPAPNADGRLPLHVKVTASEEVQGMASFTQNLIDKDITLEVAPDGLPDLQPGSSFTAFVTYQGDENGGKYLGSEVTTP